MKFLHSATVVILSAVIVVIAAITAIAHVLTERLVETAHAGDYDLMRRAFASELKAMEDEAASDAEIIATMPVVRRAFVARDRATLQAETVPMFEVVEPKWDVDRAQFHTPPGVSFLRLHDPPKFGEDQTPYRPMLAEVHHEKAARKGTAITRQGPAIYGIVPIVDDKGTFVGSFEMGLEFGPVLDSLKRSYGIEGAVFFDEKQLRDVATEIEPGIITAHNRVGKYIRYHATHPDLLASLVTDKDVEITEAKRIERTVARVPWGVQLVPLYNYANKQIGVVALALNFDEDKTLARRALVWQILAAIFAVVVVVGVVVVMIRGVLLRPLAALNERMAALAAGDASRPADPLDDYCEELRGLAASYESLRNRGNG